MSGEPERRAAVLAGHLISASPGGADATNVAQIERAPTSAAANGVEVVQYSVPLPEKLSPDGPWCVYRSALSPRKLMTTYEPPDDNVFTLYDNFEASISRYPHVPYLGTRRVDDKNKLGPYQWITYSQAGDIRTSLGSGLMQLGLTPKSGVGIYSINCKEWVLLDAACHAYSLTSVPLYDTLGPEAVEYICNHAELAAVACSAAVLPTMLQCLPRCSTVKLLIVWGAASPRSIEVPAGVDVRVMTSDALEALGRRHPRAHVPPHPSDMATICYTSGTTGLPKGAVLTHTNLIANSAGTIPRMAEHFFVGARYISYLPLAHIYERVNLITVCHTGGSIGFYAGNVLELLDDIAELKPHVFASVPRLWNRIYDRVMGTVRSGNPVARTLFERAYASKVAALRDGDLSGGRWGPFWDKLVFSKIRAKLGGDVRLLVTGASPISDEVITFMRVAFGAVVLEGYGMTESSCAMSTTDPADASTGHVGGVLPSCEIKLVDIPEMGYTGADQPNPRGEICVRGPIVFQGYYKDDAQTREALDPDGWLHTGDVGTWLPGGRLKIIDRKKNIFKLAQGEYVAPEKIENVYVRSPFVLQAFVYGDSLRSQLVGVVVPDPEVLLPWAKERGLPTDLPALCALPVVRAAVLRSMQEEGRVAKLRGFEQVAAVALVPEVLSVENGLLTPTFKLKRPQAKAAFQALLDDLYNTLSETDVPAPEVDSKL